MRIKKLILMDNNPSQIQSIESILGHKNIQVIKANNGVAGIRSVLKYHPDILIINYDMPYLNGLQVTKLLNAIGFNLPTLLLTNTQSVELKETNPSTSLYYCSADKVELKLSPLIDKLLNSNRKSYRDISYTLSQKEFMGLLAESDRKKILIVAEPVLRHMLIEELNATGLYELYFAFNGDEALYKSVFFQPDLILSEIDFQEGNGIQLAQRLYILGHPFPIIFISERNDMNTITKIKKLEGIQGYLLKNEVEKNLNILVQRLNDVFNLSESEKKHLQDNYRKMEPEKLQVSKVNSGNIDFQSWIDDLD